MVLDTLLYIVSVLVVAVAFYMIVPSTPNGLVDDAVQSAKYLVFWPTLAICFTIIIAALTIKEAFYR